ncbi:S1C family serine protease [Oceanobacillus sp. CAU 1775]
MRHKRYLPLILSVLFLLFGGFLFVKQYTDWKANEPEINQPIVSMITEESSTLDLKSIIYEAEKTVIQIEGQNEYQTITGSGFLYNDKGDIITNAHVIQDMDSIYVRTANAQFYPAAIVGISEETDIAVIRVPQLANMDYLPISEELAEIGEEIIALGSPHGFQNTVTLGIISGTDRDFQVDGYDYSNVYQISAQITHGNSGGPLIKRETGEIIGINSVGTEDGLLGFSIPISEVIEQVQEWSNTAVNDQLEFPSVIDMINQDNMEQGLQDSIYLTEHFWDSIAIRDYVNAYSLLASDLQKGTSYSDFRNRYIAIVDLDFSEIESNVVENNQIQTTITVEIEKRDEASEDEYISSERQFEFIFAYENDQLKIVNMNEVTN